MLPLARLDLLLEETTTPSEVTEDAFELIAEDEIFEFADEDDFELAKEDAAFELASDTAFELRDDDVFALDTAADEALLDVGAA